MTLMNAQAIPIEQKGAVEGSHVLVMAGREVFSAVADSPIARHWTLTLVHDYDQLQSLLSSMQPSRLIIEIEEGGTRGLELVRKAADQGVKVVVLGPARAEFLAQQSRAIGAMAYVPRPADLDEIDHILGHSALPAVTSTPRKRCQKDKPSPFRIGSLVSRSSVMKGVIEQVERVAETSATVLIHGESGTGKEIVAQAIHNLSRRCDKPFLPVNCGALSPQLVESELFGHERGSFTGAVRDHPGVFERAHGGTLFLDEITEMPLDLQVKLLRVLETQRFSRLGSVQEQKTDVRILAATNRCLQEEVERGNLREDLFYRIQVFPIALPPLRDREGDISLLAEHFLRELNKTEGTDKRFSDDALALLERYCWPGNVRELRNVVQRAYIMAGEVVSPDDFPDTLLTPSISVQQQGQSLKVKIGASVAEVERNLIYATLDYCDGRKQKAADMLGVSVKTLYNRLREYEEAG